MKRILKRTITLAGTVALLLHGVESKAETWQQTLQNSFDIVETFDELNDWSPISAPNGRSTSNLPVKSDGSSSMWDLWDYWSTATPKNTPWIGDHGVNSWSGKSLRMDLNQGTAAKSGPSRFGLYFGSPYPDGIDPYSSNGVVESGYRNDIYIFYMAKFPTNAFPKDANGFVYWSYYKVNTCSLGFTSATHAQEGSSDYGAANIHPHFQTGTSLGNHLRLTLRYAMDATWSGVTEYSTTANGANLDAYIDNSEWFGVEFHIHRGTPGVADGYQEIWVYDKNGTPYYAGKSAVTMMVPSGKNWGFNRFWFGGNTTTTATGIDTTYYVDDFIVDKGRIGPAYFSLKASGGSVADVTKPTVTIVSPVSGNTISGSSSVSVNASDNIGVSNVELYVDGTLRATKTASPYTLSWNTTSVANGSHTLIAKAYDAAGNVGQSAAVTVTVSNPVPDTIAPTVSVTAPADNAIVSATTTVSASASDSVGVSKVDFYLNGVVRASVNTAPYTFAWDTAAGADGAYTLTAKAYDAAGNVGQSASVMVTVKNAVSDTTAPAVSVTAPVNGATVSGTTSVVASASDNVGVTRVEFYVNGTLKSTDTFAPYSYAWDTKALVNGSYTLAAKAYDAAGNSWQSSSVALTVNNPILDTTPPVVTIISPAAGSKVGWYMKVSASATDNVAVTRTELYIDNALKSVTSTGSINWRGTMSKGSHVIRVTAYDGAKNAGSRSETVYR